MPDKSRLFKIEMAHLMSIWKQFRPIPLTDSNVELARLRTRLQSLKMVNFQLNSLWLTILSKINQFSISIKKTKVTLKSIEVFHLNAVYYQQSIPEPVRAPGHAGHCLGARTHWRAPEFGKWKPFFRSFILKVCTRGAIYHRTGSDRYYWLQRNYRLEK